MLIPRTFAFLIAAIPLTGLFNMTRAQDLEPRAYTSAPIGLNFVGVAIGRSSGEVVVDPSLPLTDVHATINSAAVGVGRTFSFFGRTALIFGTFPYARGEVTGTVGEERGRITRSGLADPRIRLSVNLIGGRALTASEFPKVKRPTIMGVSLAVVPPLGQYDRAKLVNLGANRWAFKPEAGLSHAVNRWTFEGYAGVWLFTENGDYYTGSSLRTQDPILAIQGHTSYTIKPRLWLAFDATWYSGGASTIDGIDKGNSQNNSRIGATGSFPLTQHQSIKAAFTKGATTRIGSNFTTVSAAWQFSWFD
jgi:hypothetical protein